MREGTERHYVQDEIRVRPSKKERERERLRPRQRERASQERVCVSEMCKSSVFP